MALYKNKGDYEDLDNWRGIALLDIVSKIMSQLLNGRQRNMGEKLWDDSYYQHFFYNWQSQVSLWERPAICEKCDSTIDPMDVRCFLCGKERSQANLAYYQGLTDLSAPPPPDDNDGIADDDDG